MMNKQNLLNRALRVACTALALSFLSAPGCKEDDENLSVNEYLYALMQDWYFWYQEIPDVDPEDYATPYELLDAVRYLPIDVWSFVMTKEEYEQYFENAEYVGFGFSFQFDENEQMRVSFVYESSPMYEQGVERGWTILEVGGTAVTPASDLDALFGPDEVGIQKTFKMQDNSGTAADYTFIKEIIDIDTVFNENVFDVGGKKVGYFVFNNFIEKSLDELEETFGRMQDNGIEDLIIDLRYNGGGLIEVAKFLGSAIGGSPTVDEVFAQYIHNDRHSDENSNLYFIDSGYTLNLSRVFFITTQATASASELVINGLDPFMDVYLVGDVTYGKPVGMYGWPYEDYVFFPVSFKTVNAEGYGDYYDGIAVDANAADEDSIHTALYFIENGEFPLPEVKEESLRKIRALNRIEQNGIEQNGLEAQRGAY
jgi:carboxyl-terminal processing protease